MSPAIVVPNKKLELGAHLAGVAVDGFMPETERLQRFSVELEASLAALEAKLASFQTPSSLRKSIRG
jgi:hypothetical protein